MSVDTDFPKDTDADKNISVDINEIIMISMAKGWGGAEEYLENLRSQLSKKGIDLKVILRDGGEYSKRCQNKAGIIQIPHSIRGFLRFAGKLHIRKGPRIIHVNRYYDIFRGWFLKKTIPNSILILYQNCYLNHPRGIPLSLLDGIICISEFVKTSITKKFPVFKEMIEVINPGIDLDLFDGEKKDYRINGLVKVGMVGRFDKNQEELIRIAWELKKRGLPVSIYFAGSGKPEEEKRIKELTKRMDLVENVSFLGYIPHQSIYHFYHDMDICVSTMKREGLSLVAMEAMTCGLPFVAYNAPGFNEVIDDRKNGILVEGGIKEFASAILSLIDSIETRRMIGKNAAKKARRFFGIARSTDKYLNYIYRLFIKRIHI